MARLCSNFRAVFCQTKSLHIVVAWMMGIHLITIVSPSAANAVDREFTVSDGSPIEIMDRGITITPPENWQILKHVPNMTLMLRDPTFDGERQLRTLQLITRAGPVFIDETTAESFSEELVKQFSSSSAAIVGYRIRNHMIVDLDDGNRGILFYAEYSAHGFSLMHMHLLTSSRKNHYLLTYNDMAENFQTSDGLPIDALAQAWQTMISLELESHAPTRFQQWFYLLFGVFAVLTLLFLYRRIKGYLLKRQYQTYADGEHLDDSGLDDDENAYNDAWKVSQSSKTATLIDDDELTDDDKDVG